MPLKLVYIDDEIELCQIFQEFFTSPEIDIKTFTSPDEAIQAIAAAPPDLVFLDFRLMGTTGLIVAERLPPALPKVLVSGDPYPTASNAFIKVFPKPYPLDDVCQFLTGFLKNKAAA